MYLDRDVRYPSTPDQEKQTLIEASQFGIRFLEEHPEKASDPRLTTMFKDLSQGAFWRVLTAIDGPYDNMYDERHYVRDKHDYPALREKAQSWALETFTRPYAYQDDDGIHMGRDTRDLHKLFEITKDLAINPPLIDGAPGYVRGHSTLLAHIVDNPYSMFQDQVSDSDRKVLANGAFWEELGYQRAIGELVGILEDHADELDPSLASYGLRIFDRNATKSNGFKLDMHNFSDAAVDNYKAFMDKLNAQAEELGIPTDRIDQLLRPYIFEIAGVDDIDSFGLRFGSKWNWDEDQKDLVEVKPQISFGERLADPLVRESLGRSKATLQGLASRIAYRLTAGDWGDEASLGIIAAVPGELGERLKDEVIVRAVEHDGAERVRKYLEDRDHTLAKELLGRTVMRTMKVFPTSKEPSEDIE